MFCVEGLIELMLHSDPDNSSPRSCGFLFSCVHFKGSLFTIVVYGVHVFYVFFLYLMKISSLWVMWIIWLYIKIKEV